MFYRRADHTFDWSGFLFTTKLIAGLALVGGGSYLGVLYAGSPGIPPAALISSETPHIEASALSSTTPQRIINTVTIQDAIPESGKFIAADLVAMKIFLYQDGIQIADYSIITKGRTGSAWETPSGMYAIQTKEETHFSSIGHVYMPWSMQFYGNYFIHGWTYYPDGTPVSATFSGGCIKLSTDDAKSVYEFADIGTKVFVYDAKPGPKIEPLALEFSPVPHIQANAYLVADIDTGDVYAEKNANIMYPIASITKLMTALVANETISFERKVSVTEGSLFNPPEPDNTDTKVFVAEDLVYPLLMQSSNGVADSLANYYGKHSFVSWMNRTAHALGMDATIFVDASGISAENLSTADDLFRLATYLANKKSFVFNVTHLTTKTIASQDGTIYNIQNVNAPAQLEPYVGGKVGHTMAAKDTIVSLLSFDAEGVQRRIAVIILGSDNQYNDTTALASWVTQTSTAIIEKAGPACITCTEEPEYRKIEI